MTINKLVYLLPFIIMGFLFPSSTIKAQDEKEEKQVIIIEKIVDENGNIISKSTRRLNGIYSEEDIQELLEEDPLPSTRSFDLEGLGFGDELQDYFQRNQKRPTIGVNLKFTDGQATVDQVMKGSGAELADVRVGDLLLSINGIAISAIDDIYNILEEKKNGDKVRLVVFRDGEELEKQVELGLSANNNLFFEFPEGGTFRLFGDDASALFPDNMDSLLKLLPRMGDLKDFNFDQFRGFSDNENPSEIDETRPSLGVYIDEESSDVTIAEIVDESAADKAGLRAGDIIMRMDDNIVTSFREVRAFMNTKNKGDKIKIEINRSGQIIHLEVTLD